MKTTHNKPLNSFISPECLFLNEEYAFSFNPLLQPNFARALGVKDWFDQMNNLFSHICSNSKFRMYVEISSTGRWHLHGIIVISDQYGFYTKDVKSLIDQGSSCMKVIEDINIWEEYMLKQQIFMQKALHDELFGPLIKITNLIFCGRYKTDDSDQPIGPLNSLNS